MYPQRELNRLAAHKTALRATIACRRVQCVTAAARLAEPFAWLDRAIAFWRRLAPVMKFAAVPLGFLLKRTLSPRLKLLGSLVKWSPLVLGALRGFRPAVGRARTGRR